MIPTGRRMVQFSGVVLIALGSRAAAQPCTSDGKICLNGNTVVVETPRYRCVFTGAVLTSFTNKLASNAEMIDAPPVTSSLMLRLLVYGQPGCTNVDLAATDYSIGINSTTATITYPATPTTWSYKLRLQVASGTDDLILVTEVTTTNPLHFRKWDFYPRHVQGTRLLLPMWGGTLVTANISPAMQTLKGRTTDFVDVPAVLFELENHAGGFAFWAHTGSTSIGYQHEVCEGGDADCEAPPVPAGKRRVRISQASWNQPVTNDVGMKYRLNTFAGNFSYGTDMLTHRPSNAPFAPVNNNPPAWLSQIRAVYNINRPRELPPSGEIEPSAHPVDPNVVPHLIDIRDCANGTFPFAPAHLQNSNILLYHNDWSPDAHDRNYPDYSVPADPNSPYRDFMAQAHAAGFRTMPHFNSTEVSKFQSAQSDPNCVQVGMNPRTVWVDHQSRIITELDTSCQAVQRCWCEDVCGGLNCTNCGLRNSVSLSDSVFRALLRDTILSVADTVQADGVYLDVSNTAWSPFDVNPANYPGTQANFSGLQTLIGDVAATGRLVAGEMTCWQTIKAGQHMNKIFPSGAVIGTVHDFEDYYRFMCPVTGMLVAESATRMGHVTMPSPDTNASSAVSWFRQYIACFFQGAIPLVRWQAWNDDPDRPSRIDHDDELARYQARGKHWANERALYALNHNVDAQGRSISVYTGPSDAWNRNDVVIVENVDGVPKRRLESWLVKMLICDWYWIYTGRAPTPAELNVAAANKHIRDGSLVDWFEAFVTGSDPNSPTAEPRGLALSNIFDIFPDYPLVHPIVAWRDDPNCWDESGTNQRTLSAPTPSSFTVVKGTPDTTDVSRLVEGDDEYLTVLSQTDPLPGLRRVSSITDFVSQLEDIPLQSLKARIEVASNQPNFNVEFKAWNYTTGSWQVLGNFPAPTTDTVFDLTGLGENNVGRLVGNEVKLRAEVYAPSSSIPHSAKYDQVKWVVQY